MCMRFYTMTPAAMSLNGARTLPPHVGPLTAELTEDDSLGGESEHSPALPRLPRLRTSCESRTRKIYKPHFRSSQVQLQLCKEVISNHLSNNRLKKDSNRRIAISSVLLNGWRITRSEERQQTRAEPARQRVARPRERASERAKARARS